MVTQVTSVVVANNNILDQHVANLQIDTRHLKYQSVTLDKLAPNAIGSVGSNGSSTGVNLTARTNTITSTGGNVFGTGASSIYANTVIVSVDGVMLPNSDYVVGTSNVTLKDSSVPSGLVVHLMFWTNDASFSGNFFCRVNTITSTGSNTFGTGSSTMISGSHIVSVDGAVQPSSEYVVSTNSITFVDASMPSGLVVHIYFWSTS